MRLDFDTCLLIAPHTDDVEFGCAGFVAEYNLTGKQFYYLALSTCEESVPQGYPKDTLRNELILASSRMNIPQSNLIIKDFKVRLFPQSRQEILQVLYDLNKSLKPDLVLCPNSNDIHQDHAVCTQEAIRAFKHSTILGYELPWNNNHFKQDVFINISEKSLNQKIDAIKAYESQSQRIYSNTAFVKSLAVVRGVQAGTEYAESFENLRMRLRK